MFQPNIVRFESLPSTNVEAARRAAEGAAEGLCIVSAEQTSGRGRLERHWVSPKDAGLYFSVILRPQIDQSRWSILTMMAAVAVHDALTEAFAVEPDIKWPNDVLINDKKVCGILAETVETGAGKAVVLGIGINLRKNSLPDELKDVATSVEGETGHRAVPDEIIEPLLGSLIRSYQMVHRPGGSQFMVQEWSKRSSFAMNKRVKIADGDAIVEGISRGLESDGALIIETDAGELRRIRTGDVTRVRASTITKAESRMQSEQQ